MTEAGAKGMMYGFVYFFAAFGFELVSLYGMSPLISTQPFVQKFFTNSPWTYFEFVGFWMWFVIIPIEFWWFVIRSVPHPRRPWEH